MSLSPVALSPLMSNVYRSSSSIRHSHCLAEYMGPEADPQECTALELGLAPLRRACETLSLKFRSEEEDLQRLSEIWTSYRPHDGRPSSLRAGALRDFRKGYFRKVVQDSEERIPRYKKTVMVCRAVLPSAMGPA